MPPDRTTPLPDGRSPLDRCWRALAHRGGRQRGYLLEVPLLVAAVLVVGLLLLPHLGPGGRKLAVGAGAGLLLAGAYYLLLAPGRLVGAPAGPPRAVRRLLFGALALVLVLGAGAFIGFG